MRTRDLAAVMAIVGVMAGAAWGQQRCPVRVIEASGGQGDAFGGSVAISGDTMVAGARGRSVGLNVRQGAAWVYRRSGAGWTLEAMLTSSDGAAGDDFGISVGVFGDTVVVGALKANVGANAFQGSAYVFSRTGGVWTQQAKLAPADGEANDGFGRSVTVFGDTALVGANHKKIGTQEFQGAVYVFTRSGAAWTQQVKLLASDGAGNEFFGSSVGLFEDSAVVGALYGPEGVDFRHGSAYVFTRTGGTWTQQAKLTAPDDAHYDYFGESVAISGNTVMVGASGDSGANAYQGSAYVFKRTGQVWSQQAKLIASDAAVGDSFGVSVSISEDTAVAGAFGAGGSVHVQQGAAYLFKFAGGVWTQKAKLAASENAAGYSLGISVGVGGDTVVVGANGDRVGPYSEQGSAWIFSHSGATWTGPDFNNSGVVTPQDLFDFLAAYLAGDPRADYDGVGGLNKQDLTGFLAAFFPGCG